MKSFFDLDEYTQVDIESLIKNKIEEALNLDYKSGDALKKDEKSKKELAKDVSAFANSAGGVIVYGILEKNHVPDSYVFVDGNEITKEWIEQVIQTRVQRKIEGLQIFPIRFQNDISQTVYLIKIPESFDAPHMTKNKRFYKRYNFESVYMEEYEVRNLYQKVLRSSLHIDIPLVNKSKYGRHKYVLWFYVSNWGKVLEKEAKLEVVIPSKILDLSLNGENFIKKNWLFDNFCKKLNIL